jgi:hypothetical protein
MLGKILMREIEIKSRKDLNVEEKSGLDELSEKKKEEEKERMRNESFGKDLKNGRGEVCCFCMY